MRECRDRPSRRSPGRGGRARGRRARRAPPRRSRDVRSGRAPIPAEAHRCRRRAGSARGRSSAATSREVVLFGNPVRSESSLCVGADAAWTTCTRSWAARSIDCVPVCPVIGIARSASGTLVPRSSQTSGRRHGAAASRQCAAHVSRAAAAHFPGGRAPRSAPPSRSPSPREPDDDLIARILDEAKRDPGRDRQSRCAGRGSASGCSPTRLRARRHRAGACCSRRTSSTRRSLGAVFDSRSTTAPAVPHAELAGDRRALRARLQRAARRRPPHRRSAPADDRLRRVRAARRRARAHRYLATAFSTADVPAQIADAWRLYLACSTERPVVSGAFTRARRAADGELMELFRADRADLVAQPDDHLHRHRNRQLPLRRGLLPEPARLRRRGIPVEIVPVTLLGLVAPVTLVARPSSTPWTCWRACDGAVVRPGRRCCSAAPRRPSHAAATRP